MTALLETYTDTDADKAKDDARECVRVVVIDPSTFIFDHLLQLTAVKRLEKVVAAHLLADLLEDIFRLNRWSTKF